MKFLEIIYSFVTSLVLLNNCISISAFTVDNVTFDASASSQHPKRPLPPLKKVYIDGEYKVNVRYGSKAQHVETGEYEMRDGRQVIIVRGFFQYFDEENNVDVVQPYVFDRHGYHEIQTNIIDTRIEETDVDCDLDAGRYCIDVKLLRLLVG